MKTIDELVNRFLRWKLPKGFSPDGGISFKRIPDFPELNKWEYEPVGTNLFSAEQAKEMFEYLLSEPQPILSQRKPTISKMETNDPVGYAVWNEVENEWDLDRSIKNHHDMGHVDNSKILPVYLAPAAELFGKVEQLKLENE